MLGVNQSRAVDWATHKKDTCQICLKIKREQDMTEYQIHMQDVRFPLSTQDFKDRWLQHQKEHVKSCSLCTEFGVREPRLEDHRQIVRTMYETLYIDKYTF